MSYPDCNSLGASDIHIRPCFCPATFPPYAGLCVLLRVPYIFDNMSSLPRKSPVPQTCLVVPITSPCTPAQSIVPSKSSSTRPHTATVSPRTMYSPRGTSSLGMPSSLGRTTRSTAPMSTRFIDPSQEKSVPTMVRPSVVRTETFSGID